MNLSEELKALVRNSAVLSGEFIGADYCRDELPGGSAFSPEAVVEAANAEDIAAVVKFCRENSLPLTVRGAGTGQAGGSVPVKGGVVLSLKGMNHVLGYDEERHILRVESGVLLQDVKEEAAKHGMYYPPDPGEPSATVGGNAATNASGLCAVKYGRTADYIEDAVFILADGSVHTVSEDEKYRDIIGSEGTLAVITELSLRLIEKPAADAVLLFPFMDAESAVNAAITLNNAGFEPAMAEFMDTDLVEFSGKVTGNSVFPVDMDGDRTAATLMLSIEAEDDDSVMEKMEAIAEMAEDLECLDILVGDTPSMKRDFLAAHAAFHTSMESGAKSAYEANISIPAEQQAEMIAFARAEAEKLGLRALINSHILSGEMHIHIASELSFAESSESAKVLIEKIYAECGRLSGSARGVYGWGYAKNGFLDAEFFEKHSALKAQLDEKGILNPGKLLG